ncbi:MAG: hypothetical protein DLM56_03260 [Pseudonocardiales bacterium]|nr:MAG: hypothetical protein DLM56_03260 [Pseudonocardiales bacterium]
MPVDERNSCWEEHRPRFRAYLFHRENPQSSWAVETYDIVDADAIEAIAWTEDQARSRPALRARVGQRVGAEPDPVKAHRGLTWLVGMDANDNPQNAYEQGLLDGMGARRGRRTVVRR